MRLYEFEGKEIARKYGIPVPASIILKQADKMPETLFPSGTVVKSQLLILKSRAKAGAVRVCDSAEEARHTANSLLTREFEGEMPPCLMLEEKVDISGEYYLGITYDTSTRSPVIIFNAAGGIDVESSSGTQKLHVDPALGLHEWMIRDMLKRANVKQDMIVKLADVIRRAYNCFASEDCRLLEMNPIAETKDGKLIAVDVAVETDDDASFRHKDRNFGERSKRMTEREVAVKKANAVDYKGTIKYTELDGNIGFLAAGGGGSLTCMDALMGYDAKPSNYTEYSGNPSADKVYELTKQILSKPGLKGLWIVGAIANFTRVDTTMEGITRALVEVKPGFPIVVRRSGPFEKEGLEILRNAAKQHGLDMHIYGKELPMTESAKIIAQASREWREN